MNTLRTILIIIAINSLININSKGQTMHWDENYAETIFQDSFSGTVLDRNKWDASIFKREIGLLIDSSATIEVNNRLGLSMISCPNSSATSWDGTTYYGDYAGGEIVSKERFQYGIFECTATFATNLGSWPAFWIIGGDDTPCPPGGYGNEIDIAELKCKTVVTEMGHVIHRYHPPINCSVPNEAPGDCKTYNIQLNNTPYHYKCVWTPYRISYYINNNLMYEIQYDGQEWYPYLSLHIILSQQIIGASNLLGQPQIVTPQTTYFDNVSVKQFFSTPEIVCPENICSSGNATLAVDNRATNIIWELTPSNLFTGTTSGSGINASINIASGAGGMGTITYSFEMPSGETFTAAETFWAGAPNEDNISIDIFQSLDNQLCYDEDRLIMALYDKDTKEPTVTEFEWDMGDIDNYVTGYFSDIVLPYKTNQGVGVSLTDDYYNSTATVKVRAKNTCGTWSAYKSKDFPVDYCDTYYMMITPNPTTEETTLSIESTSAKTAFDENDEWDLEIYNQTQSLKEKKTKIKEKGYKLKTSGWKAGVYFVRAKYKDKLIQGKLIVKE